MALIFRVTSEWTGFNGAPGYSVTHFRDPAMNGTQTRTEMENLAYSAQLQTWNFFGALDTQLPSGVSITVNPEVELIEDTTGELQDVYATTPNVAVIGSGGLQYSGPSGAVVNWRTPTIRNGRRIRGRTFIVPLQTAAYDESGNLNPAAQGVVRDAAAGVIAGTSTVRFGVYGRPSTALANDGVWAEATSSSVPDLAAVLRSRRD